ncbi:MAG: hypothetical protein IPH18_11565 [Chitinophagaceae bacterium]|nr:hypothetical protein [Chitinophagaceae bacterium]
MENRRKETERLSGGRIGYVHVRGMNDPSMRVVIDEVLGKNLDKEALVVDTRFNGGGNLHEQLSDFLSGKNIWTSYRMDNISATSRKANGSSLRLS